MRVLLDESLPRKLALELTGDVAQTVQKHGWSGLKNGALLSNASVEFDVFLTGDQNLEFQQNTTTCLLRSLSSSPSTIALNLCAHSFPHCLKPSKAFVQDSFYESVPNHALDRTPGRTRWLFAR